MATNDLIILLAEDDPNDVVLLKRAFAKVGVAMPVHVCSDGEEALAYLRGEGEYADRAKYPFPRVLITDLKMPKVSGIDLLRWLQTHPECNLIPTIVLSSSREPRDIVEAYQLGLNCFLTKPPTFNELCDLVRVTEAFWRRCELPPLPPNC